jgi:predicted ATP-grasp superfamily ATP-dependent carboligase
VDVGPSSLAGLLERLAFERMVLIPCTDDWVRAVAKLEPALAARFPASLAPRESLEILLDKGRLAEAAQHHGVPHPRTICLASEDDLAPLPDSAFRDSFLKPRDTLAFQRRYRVKAFRFETRAQAVVLVREARRAGLQLVLQEYIPGPPTRHYFLDGFVDRTGTVCACIVSWRLRMFPPDFGDGSYGVSIRLEEVAPAMDVVKRFLGALRYRGVFDAEFKYDERDGLFKVLEINTRPYGTIGFAAESGVDLVAMAYRDALGLPIEPVTEYEVGRHYLNPYPDLFGGWRLIQEGKLTSWTWARSWLGAYQLTFAWDDPLPAVVGFLGEARRFAQRRVRRRSSTR